MENTVVTDAPEVGAGLIVIEQLPVLQEQLDSIKQEIDKKAEAALALECKEDNRKDIKSLRADLNREKKALDANYRAVMERVTAPLTAVQTKYKECVSGYTRADKGLKEKIDVIEDKLKADKYDEVSAYFEELKAQKGIDFVTLEQAGVKVGLSDSVKKLKEQAESFVGRVKADVTLIEGQEDKDEILDEYKQTLNAVGAINTVKARKSRIEEERRRRAEQESERIRRETAEKAAIAAAEQVEAPLAPPEEVDAVLPELQYKYEAAEQDSEKRYRLTFTVLATKAELKKLKEFLIEGGYDYE